MPVDPIRRRLVASLLCLLLAGPVLALEIAVTFPASLQAEAVDGRVLLLLATDAESEPRFQVSGRTASAQVFGVDVEGLGAGEPTLFTAEIFGYPAPSLAAVPPGDYIVQAVLQKYDTFDVAHGHTLKLPMDQGEGRQWNRAPGNLFSTPRTLRIDPAAEGLLTVELDQVIPPIEKPEDTQYIRHVEIESALLSEFWGRPMKLGAHVLLPEGWDEHPEARYPLMIFHGHFPDDFGGFRTTPPDQDLECEPSARFDHPCYNRVVQQEAYDFYKKWSGPDFPRLLIVEIQHANPFYDDSYAVNSANLGPYGDAITYELIPFLEKTFRGLGEGWARFLYGGSTGGWEALAAQIFYPDAYGGAFGACPDPIDFRAYTSIDLYADDNAYWIDGPFQRLEHPAHRNYLGHVDATVRTYNHMELALGTKGRSGDQFDIWQAV